MSTLGLYFHTLRHLKPAQIAGRFRAKLNRPAADTSAPPPRRPMPTAYVDPIRGAPTFEPPDTFRFLNETRRCASAADWHPAEASALWIYNLHYFDDLNARKADFRRTAHEQLLERWVAENPPAASAAWDPYPTSRRIVNWVKWCARGAALSPRWHASLAVQARWLARRIEYHLLGNHLFMNAKALLHAGSHFDGPEAESWRAQGLEIVRWQLPEQVLADGGHFERSTMYHAAALEDLLDLLNLHRAYGMPVPETWLSAAARMQRWAHATTHPDGDIAFFNDSAIGIAPRASELDAYAQRLQLAAPVPLIDPLLVLAASGYVRACAGPVVLLCDCAPVGPDYLPAHAHADTLSFELSVNGRRVFVNSGTSQYGVGTERQRQRGTAAHNTVVVDGRDSSEVWGGFRVARRARCVLHRTQPGPPILIEASHDGYCRLSGRNVHRRRWLLDTGSLRIEDEVSGRFDRAEAFFYLHPDIEVRHANAAAVELRTPDGALLQVTFEGAAAVDTRATTWHPHFGVAAANRCVVARLGAPRLVTRILWPASS